MLGQPDLLSGRYEPLRELGRGVMGVVHLARDHVLDGAEVAVKILPKELEADPRALARLKREAMTAVKITHPNVMRLINYEESGDLRFLVMEYIDGPDLLHVLAGKPDGKLDLATFLRYAEGICAGVAYAHARNVVHADLKPANIMLTSAGEVKITDFGVAQVVRETMTRVSRVETAGTLLYMSPELHDGAPNTALSDQYALGITFYEMLAGEPSFIRGDVTNQHKTKPVPPLTDVPEHVNAAILKALSKRPEDRWPDVATFARALRGEVETPITDWREAKTETFPCEDGPGKASGARPLKEEAAKRKRDGEDQGQRQTGEAPAKRRGLLLALFRAIEAAAVPRLPVMTLSGHTGWVRSVAVAGDTIVSGALDSTVRVWDLNSGQLLRTLTGHTSYVLSVAVAGDRIVSGSADDTIRILRMP